MTTYGGSGLDLHERWRLIGTLTGIDPGAAATPNRAIIEEEA